MTTTQYTVQQATAGTNYQVTVAAVYDGVTGGFTAPDSVTTTGPAQQLSRTLHPGWNTLSLPYTLSASAQSGLTTVLNTATVAYVYQNGNWDQVTHSNVAQVLATPMLGLYIDWPSTASATTVSLTPTSQIHPPPSLSLVSGWNLVGPSSISPSQSDTGFLAGLPSAAIAEIVDPNGNPSAVSNPLATGANTLAVRDGLAYWLYVETHTASLSGQIATGNVN